MYFWNIQKLEEDLKKGLSEKEDMKYLLLLMALFMLATIPMVTNPNMYDYILGISMVIFTIIEVLTLYKFNKGEKGKNFLSRYLSIGWVMMIRTLVFVMIPLVILYILANIFFLGNPDFESSNISDIVLNIVYLSIYLYLQIQSFKRVNV